MDAPEASQKVQWSGGTAPSRGMAARESSSSRQRAASSGGGAGPGAGRPGKVGEGPVVELSPHEPPLVDPLVEHRGGGEEQPGAGAGVAGGAAGALWGGHRGVDGPPGEKGDPAPLRQAVKVIVAPPQAPAVPGVPGQGAAPRRTPGTQSFCPTHCSSHLSARRGSGPLARCDGDSLPRKGELYPGGGQSSPSTSRTNSSASRVRHFSLWEKICR